MRESPLPPNRHKIARLCAGALTLIGLLAGGFGIVSALARSVPHLSADVFVDANRLKAASGLEPDVPFDLQGESAFIAGPTVLGAALKRPEVAQLEIARRESAEGLARRVNVEFRAPGILRISLSRERTDEAVRLVNAIANAYIDEMLDESDRLRAERIRLLERGQRDARRRIAEKRDAIARLSKVQNWTPA
jgi:hypothetical protein